MGDIQDWDLTVAQIMSSLLPIGCNREETQLGLQPHSKLTFRSQSHPNDES